MKASWLRWLDQCVIVSGKQCGDAVDNIVIGYAREELVAEIGAAFLCCDLGITPEPRDDHAAYLGHWLKVLKNDKRAIFQAASHAQRAVDFQHGLQSCTARIQDRELVSQL